MIYFVACPGAGAVKIGICWGNPNALHSRFTHLRIHGEWFRLADELRDFISGFPPAPEKELRGGHTKNRKRRQWFEENTAA